MTDKQLDIRVCEMFPAIQGEGATTGQPVYFVRLSGCNLNCYFCDSKYHNDGNNMTVIDLTTKLYSNKINHIVFTGGEPMIQHKPMMSVIHKLQSLKPNMIFDMETNGSIYDNCMKEFDNIACSPKVEHVLDGKGYVRDSYKQIAKLKNVNFKFVYDDKTGTWFEEVIRQLDLDKRKVWIMPEGATREEQEERMPKVIEYCIKKGYNFSPRVQVLAYNTKRGV